MWVRSQNKKSLMNVENFWVTYFKQNKTFNICSDGTILGPYSTEEKALKVLDMIQEHIIKDKGNLLRAIYNEPAEKCEFYMIFQIPKEEEVEEWKFKN